MNKREIAEKILNPSKLGQIEKVSDDNLFCANVIRCTILKDESLLIKLYKIGYKFAYRNEVAYDEIKSDYITIYIDKSANGNIILDLSWGGDDYQENLIEKKYFIRRQDKLKRLLK